MPVLSADASGNQLEAVKSNRGPSVALAATGTVIGNAAAIVGAVTQVSGANDAAGVILPSTARPGDQFEIYNIHATAGLKIYPHVGGDLNDGTANAAVVMEGKTRASCLNLDGTTWSVQFTANA